MYLKKSSISKAMIILLVLMHLCYFLILFSGTSLFAGYYISKPRMMLFLAMIIIAVLCSSLYTVRYMWLEFAILAVIWIRAWIGASVEGYAWDDILAMLRPYLYPLLALPIFTLLLEKEWNFNSLLKFIVVANTIDSLARAFNSLSMTLTGSLLWTNLINSEEWYRGDTFRINPSDLSILVVPIAFYLASKSERFKDKLLWWGCILIDVLYAVNIWAARSGIIYKIIILVILLYLQRVTDRKKLFRFAIGIVAVMVLINTPYIGNLIESFSVTNAEYGGSTVARSNSILYFMAIYSQNVLWGVGLLETSARYAIGGGMLEDLGFLYSVVQFGIPMIVFYVLIFIRGINVYLKKKNIFPDEALLALSMTILFIMFGINIDSFYLFALAIPFYIAFIEYINTLESEENVLERY